jgi:UDP-N-acetylmuramate dehydrogenase
MNAVDRAVEVLGPLARPGVPLGRLTTYRVGGTAAVFVEAAGPDALAQVARAARASGLAVLVVGNGSNLLVADAGFDGIAVRLGPEFAEVDVPRGEVPAGAHVTVRAGGAALLPLVARRTAAGGLRGFEWAVGVPGSVGGAVRMNAGGHGADMAASLVRVRVLDLRRGDDEVVDARALDLRYRHSALNADQVVVWAELDLVAGDAAAAEAEIAEIVRWRREHQPGGANAGSVFTNPPGDSAGRLIDAAGCKGMRVGSAVVSMKHANFIQADDGGSADDVYALMTAVRSQVLAHAGVLLEAETRLVGFPPLDSPTNGRGDG